MVRKFGIENNPSVACIIPSWNQRGLLRKCLTSLQSQAYASLSIIVVDNGSSDGTAEMVATEFADVHLLCNEQNLGFAVATNQGIRAAMSDNADFFFLLNNDAVVESDTISTLIDVAVNHSKGAGIWGCQIVEEIGDRSGSWYQRLRTRSATQMQQDSGYVDQVFGCGMLLSRAAVSDFGMFDERYFAYCEDIDLCYQARRHGWRIYYCAEARIYHESAASTGGIRSDSRFRSYLIGRNQVWMWRKFGGATFSFLLLMLPLRLAMTLAASPYRSRPSAAFAKALGFIHGIFREPRAAQRIPKFVLGGSSK